MKAFKIFSVVALSAASFVACGVDQTNETLSATANASDTFYVSRLGDTSKCLQGVQTSGGLLATLGSCSGISPTRVRYMNGAPYTPGVQTYVTISFDGQCLTNPAGQPGAQDGRLVFKPCNDDGTEYGLRQMFMVSYNANNAVQIRSNLDLLLNRPNPQPACMESPSPGAVKLQSCSGLNNWQLWR